MEHNINSTSPLGGTQGGLIRLPIIRRDNRVGVPVVETISSWLRSTRQWLK